MLSVLANLGEMVLSDGRQSVVIGASQRRHAERRAGKGTPTSGQFSRWGPAQPAEGGRREGPPVPRWSLLGRDPGVQRHPDGCVVHAFRCASRSGAGPHRENWPEVGVPVPARHLDCWGSRAGLHFHSNWPAFPCRRSHPDRWIFRRDGIFTATAAEERAILWAECVTPEGNPSA